MFVEYLYRYNLIPAKNSMGENKQEAKNIITFPRFSNQAELNKKTAQ